MASNTMTSEDTQALLSAQDIRTKITQNYLCALLKIREYIKVPEISKDYTEIGLSVFAVVNNMITCSACIVTVCWFILLVTEATFQHYPNLTGDLTMLAMVHALSAIAFAFSLILLKGLFQKKPLYMKAYYVFGMTVVLIGLAQMIPVLFITGFSNLVSYDTNTLMLEISLAVTFFSIFYYVILAMVWASYKKMLEEQEGLKDEEQQKEEKCQKDDQQKDDQQKNKQEKVEQQNNKNEQQNDEQEKDVQQKEEVQKNGLQEVDAPKTDHHKNATVVETV